MKLKLTPGYSALQSGFLPTRSTGTDKQAAMVFAD
jgi:hypothetical protein